MSSVTLHDLKTHIAALSMQTGALTQQIINMQDQLDRMERDHTVAASTEAALLKEASKDERNRLEEERATRIHNRYMLLFFLGFILTLSLICSGTMLKNPQVILSGERIIREWTSSPTIREPESNHDPASAPPALSDPVETVP